MGRTRQRRSGPGTTPGRRTRTPATIGDGQRPHVPTHPGAGVAGVPPTPSRRRSSTPDCAPGEAAPGTPPGAVVAAARRSGVLGRSRRPGRTRPGWPWWHGGRFPTRPGDGPAIPSPVRRRRRSRPGTPRREKSTRPREQCPARRRGSGWVSPTAAASNTATEVLQQVSNALWSGKPAGQGQKRGLSRCLPPPWARARQPALHRGIPRFTRP